MSLLLVVVIAAPPSALAQDFSPVLARARVGDHLFVTDRTTGVEVSGTLTSLDPSELRIDGYSFRPKAGLTIERRGDTVWDGAAAGFLVGMLAGITIGAEACLDRSNWYCALQGGGIYFLIGAAIDGLHAGRTTIYRSAGGGTVRLAPHWVGGRRGVALTIAFR
jgi:hypothetical protein